MNKLALNGLSFSGIQLLKSPSAVLSAIPCFRELSVCNVEDAKELSKKEIKNETKCTKGVWKKKKEPFKSMWCQPPCIPSEETCPYPTFDQLYYKRSDKCKRKYQKTWVDCPAPVKKVKICDRVKDCLPPEIRRRSKKAQRKKGSQSCGGANLDLMCMPKKKAKINDKCPKITLSACRQPKSDYKCMLVRTLSDCKPPKPPYPSFSECIHPDMRPRAACECNCLSVRSMCEVWTILRRKAIL